MDRAEHRGLRASGNNTLQLVPAEGWKDETEFNAWFSSPAVSADRDECGARWEDKRVYGTATAMNPRNAGTYSKNIEIILEFLDKPSSSTPAFETTVRFLRGAKSDKRKAFPQVGGPLTSLHVASESDDPDSPLFQRCGLMDSCLQATLPTSASSATATSTRWRPW